MLTANRKKTPDLRSLLIDADAPSAPPRQSLASMRQALRVLSEQYDLPIVYH